MKKTFRLESPGHAPARVVESVKSEVRKYLKRERRKPLPEGADFHDFDCRFGRDAGSATAVEVKDIMDKIDAASKSEWDGFYLEIIAKTGNWIPRQKTAEEGSGSGVGS